MRRVYCATLGCDKNLVDSEALLGKFLGSGIEPVAAPEDADIWVLNSCGFIDAARTDSEDALRDMADNKGDRTLVVCGCWSQEHSDRIRRDFPEVDVVAGVGQFDRVVEACGGATVVPSAPSPFPMAGQPIVEEPMSAPYGGMLERPLLTPPHIAFVKIGEGCNCSCTFCRIPLIRGKQRSRPVAEVVAEVRGLVARGVTEIQLVSQNTSDFGRDTGEKLLDLVTGLDAIDGLRRQRLLYLYAGLVSIDDLRRLIDLPTVAPYLDLPVQHASPRVLKAMRRPGGLAGSVEFFAALREHNPDVVLRSTALLGFPGEEEEDVEILADFLAAVRFDHVGTYRYSPEAGTPAADMDERVPDELIMDREALIMDLQMDIALGRQETRLDRTWSAVVDEILPAGEADLPGVTAALAEGVWTDDAERSRMAGVCGDGGLLALARTEHYGYDLDGGVLLPAGDLVPGTWLDVRFVGVSPYDTWARPAAADGRKGKP